RSRSRLLAPEQHLAADVRAAGVYLGGLPLAAVAGPEIPFEGVGNGVDGLEDVERDARDHDPAYEIAELAVMDPARLLDTEHELAAGVGLAVARPFEEI